MADEVLKKVLLEYTQGSSDKFYELTLLYNDVSMKYDMYSRYGRRRGNWRIAGGATRHLKRSNYKSTLERQFNVQLKSKKDKGYKVVKKSQKETVKKVKKKKKPSIKELSLARFGDLDI